MKSNLILKKFSTNSVPGTMNQKELRTFFGGKIIYTEDTITINSDTIQYSQYVDDLNNGFQYYDISASEEWETKYNENLSDLKYINHTISLFSQNTTTLVDNTNWKLTINGTKILKDYLFFKIKEQRVFKNVNANETFSNNVNTAIYDYISNNIFSRYRLEKINFYAKYYDINAQTIYDDIILQYNPKFDINSYSKEYLSNINVIGYDPYTFDKIEIQYNQANSSESTSFTYYYDLIFTKI